MDSRNTLTTANTDSFLLTEPATEILPWLEIKDLGRLGLTCTFFNTQRTIARAAHYVAVEKSLVAIKQMLDSADPPSLKQLLSKKIARVATKSSRTLLNNTLFQLALGEGDDEMCHLLKGYFERAFDEPGKASKEIENQLDEKFSTNNEKDQQVMQVEDLKTKNYLSTLLKAVINAITDEQFNHGQNTENKWILGSETLNAITTFREKLDALQPKTADLGLHFRFRTLQETYTVYVQASIHWRNNIEPMAPLEPGQLYRKRCGLFEDGVLSWVLGYVSANDAERFSQGLLNFTKNPAEPFKRCNIVYNTNIHFYDYLKQASPDFTELTGSCVNIFDGSRASRSTRPWWEKQLAHYCEKKLANLFSLFDISDNLGLQNS